MEKNSQIMKLSIIIPVYNSERFLEQCLRSVFDQDLAASEYEVIVINDGSKDRSKEIILDFQSKHPNLVFIDQENQGVSTARNVGLDIAKGEYITFVDSDDEIEMNSLRSIFRELSANQLDILYPMIDTYSEEGEKISSISFDGKYGIVNKGIIQERRTFTSTFYHKNLLLKNRFNTNIQFGEDTVFNAKAQAFANRVCFVEIPYYKYTVRANSLSKQGGSEAVFRGILKAIEELRDFQMINFKDSEEAKMYFDKVYGIFVIIVIEVHVMLGWNRKNYAQLESLLRQKKLQYILRDCSSKYPFLGQSFEGFMAFQNYLYFKTLVYQRLIKKNITNVRMMSKIFNDIGYLLKNFGAKHFFSPPNVMLIDETIKHILKHKSSVSRFGDGELMIILGHGIGFQKADQSLQVRLIEILKNDSINNLIVTVPDIFTNEKLALRTEENQNFWRTHLSRHRKDWYKYMDRKKNYFNTAISRFYYPIKDKSKSLQYAALLKKIWEGQHVLVIEGEFSRLGVGNDLFENASSLQRILCPAKNAFDLYNEILQDTEKHAIGKLVLIALGPTATVLAADLAKKGFWAIDIGHVDMEYMWLQQKSKGRTPIKGRMLNEVEDQQDRGLDPDEERNYLNSIITKIA